MLVKLIINNSTAEWVTIAVKENKQEDWQQQQCERVDMSYTIPI